MSEKPNNLKSDELNSSANKKSRGSSSSDERPDRRQNPDRRGPSPVRSYLENDIVFPENEIGNEAFIVKSGSIEIFKTLYKDGEKTREAVLGVLGEGSLFGEMALIEDEKRMAGARAIGGPVSVYVISRSQFKEKLKPINPFIVRLLQVLAANVRSSANKLIE